MSGGYSMLNHASKHEYQKTFYILKVMIMTVDDEKDDIEYLKNFKSYISSSVDMIDFLLHCNFFSFEEKVHFNEFRDQKVASKILDRFLNKSDVRNKRQRLIDIFEQMENYKLANLLRKKHLPTKSRNKKKINEMLPTICMQIKVEDLLAVLRKKDVLNDVDIQAIKTKLKANGNYIAAVELVFRMPGREIHWFGKFIESLIETGQSELASDIDENLSKEIQLDETKRAFEGDEASCGSQRSIRLKIENIKTSFEKKEQTQMKEMKIKMDDGKEKTTPVISKVMSMAVDDDKDDIEYLEKLKFYISSSVDSVEFLLYCDFFTFEEKGWYFKELGDQKVASSKIALEILEILLKKSDVQNAHQKLIVLFEQMENYKLENLLRKKRLPTKSRNKKKINEKLPTICMQIRVEDLLAVLRKKDVLNDVDLQAIEAKLTTNGNYNAAVELVYRMPGREIHWFGKFIESLIETGQSDLASDIDEKMFKEIQLDETKRAFEGDEASCGSQRSIRLKLEDIQTRFEETDQTQMKEMKIEMDDGKEKATPVISTRNPWWQYKYINCFLDQIGRLSKMEIIFFTLLFLGWTIAAIFIIVKDSQRNESPYAIYSVVIAGYVEVIGFILLWSCFFRYFFYYICSCNRCKKEQKIGV